MKNVGKLDAKIRYGISVVLILIGLLLGDPLSSVSIILYVSAVVLAATGAVGFCGLYKLIGVNTCPLEERK